MNVEHRERLIRNATSLLSRFGTDRGLEHLPAGGRSLPRPELSDRGEEIVERVAEGRPLSDAEAADLEAIILPKLRPVFDISRGRPGLPGCPHGKRWMSLRGNHV